MPRCFALLLEVKYLVLNNCVVVFKYDGPIVVLSGFSLVRHGSLLSFALACHNGTYTNPNPSCMPRRPSLRLQPVARATVTLKSRLAIAQSEFAVGPTCHITNGDEENVPLFAGQYHKSLPHDKFGQVYRSTST